MPALSSSTAAHKASVTIKALEVAEEKEAIAQYGSSDSGATLGDILGTALKHKGEEEEEGETKGVKTLASCARRIPGLRSNPGQLLLSSLKQALVAQPLLPQNRGEGQKGTTNVA